VESPHVRHATPLASIIVPTRDRRRLLARDAGGDLTWDAFAAAYRPTWRERWRDYAAPRYTLRRVRRQRPAVRR